MNKKKIVPVLLLGGGVIAAAIAFWPKSTTTGGGGGTGLPTATPSTTGSFTDNITNLFNSLFSGYTTVSTALASTGKITGVQYVYVLGNLMTGLIVNKSVSFKSGDSIKITPDSGMSSDYNNTFTIAQMGNEFGLSTDRLIVINKPFVAGSFTGSYSKV